MHRRLAASTTLTTLLAGATAALTGAAACSSDDTNGVEPSAAPQPSTEAAPPVVAEPPSPEVGTDVGLPATVSEPPPSEMLIEEVEPLVTVEPEKDCAGAVLEPETLTFIEPVMMYIVLDNSKSMIEGKEEPGNLKWDQAVKAFTEFATDPTSDGIGLGIQYFNPSAPPAVVAEHEARVAAAALDPDARRVKPLRYRPDECDGIAHAQSAMEVGRLPAVADAFIESLAEADPRSNTPTVGALTGGVEFCKQYQQQNPDEQCVLVFVTDGQPNGCGLGLGCRKGLTPNSLGQCTDPDSEGVLTPIVQAAHDDHGVTTYTVGMDGVNKDGFDLLDKLAATGGTDCTPNTPGKESCDVSVTGGAGLLEALNLIRDTIVQKNLVPCKWQIPPAEEGKRVDPELVNVKMTLRSVDVPLFQVPTQAECSATEGGWYYNTALNPTEIHTCAQTCDIVNANPDDVRVSLEFGCATKKATVK